MKVLTGVLMLTATLAGCAIVPAYYEPAPRVVRVYPASPPPAVYFRYHERRW